jgi:signal transduction histidine kinase
LEGGYFLEVLGSDGSVLYRSNQLIGQMLGPVPTDRQPRERGHAASLRLKSGTLVRTITRHHRLPGGRLVMVRLGVSEEPYWREFWEMVGILAIGLPVIVVVVFIAGRLLAARALKPVEVMAKRAAEITADRLNERITIKNPDDELGQLGTAFNATLARLESSFAQLRRFTADASHELRTPLTAIRSVGEVALGKGGSESYYRDMIGSMLLLEVLAEEKGQSIRVEGIETIRVNADRTILRQAFVNLIDNAVKFSPEKGIIQIRVREDGSDAIVEVQDDGPGVPVEHRARIFERFYRVDRARARQEGGTGLGLSIVEWAVTVHRGTIEVDCESGRGSIFRVRLPRHISSMLDEARGTLGGPKEMA